MKALSVKQPWAGLIKAGYKNAEVRSWYTHYRGDIVIHSCAGPDNNIRKYYTDLEFGVGLFQIIDRENIGAELGVTLCVARITECIPLEKADIFHTCIQYSALKEHFPEKKFFAWILEQVRPVKPVLIKGKLAIWNIDDSLIKYLD